MKHIGNYFVINGWEITRNMGGINFIHYGEVYDGESHNNNGQISVTYFIRWYNDKGESVGTYRYSPDLRADIPRWVDIVENESDIPEPDKERPTIEVKCTDCKTTGEMLLVKGRSLSNPRVNEHDHWHCKSCGYTYFETAVSKLPEGAYDKVLELEDDSEEVANFLDAIEGNEHKIFEGI